MSLIPRILNEITLFSNVFFITTIFLKNKQWQQITACVAKKYSHELLLGSEQRSFFLLLNYKRKITTKNYFDLFF